MASKCKENEYGEFQRHHWHLDFASEVWTVAARGFYFKRRKTGTSAIIGH